MKFEKYNSNLSYSYVFGAFGTIEMLTSKKSECIAVLVDPSFVNNEAFNKIKDLCKNSKIQIIIDKKVLDKIKDKGNIYVIGVFKKYQHKLSNNQHILLSNVNDVGVIGTIIRSMRGFNFENLVLLNCNVDIYHEHLIRSTMGAIFKTNVLKYNSLKEYKKDYPENILVNITSKGNDLSTLQISNNITLIFNETTNEEEFININMNQDISLENIVNIVLFTLYK